MAMTRGRGYNFHGEYPYQSAYMEDRAMRKKMVCFAVLFFFICATGTAAEEIAGLSLHIEKLAPKVVRIWVGDHVSSTATTAIATSRGIVVIDTLGCPKIDAELRRVIARELDRDDFRYLINTHGHGDHTQGNSVYADCIIVAHELVPGNMKESFEGRKEAIQWYEQHLPELRRELEKKPAGDPARASMKERLASDTIQYEVLKSDAMPALPGLTFSDRMGLDLGDAMFELYYTGGMHSPGDIAIFDSRDGLLFTGDTMADVWLNETPGCLASFVARHGVRHDFPLLLKNWELLLERKQGIKKLVTGHWNGELSMKGFEERVAYVRTLWDETNRSYAGGGTLRDLLAACDMKSRFPELADSPGFSPYNNYSTIVEMWTEVTGQQSGAMKLYELIDAGEGSEAIEAVMAEKDAAKPKYFFLEEQVNACGYRFVQDNKLEKAIAIFRLNVRLYPQGWNTYDSLAETLLKAGDVKTAKELYEKSLQLNPESRSGKDALERIKKGKWKVKKQPLPPPPA